MFYQVGPNVIKSGRKGGRFHKADSVCHSRVNIPCTDGVTGGFMLVG